MLLIQFTNGINISGDNGSPCFNPIAKLKNVHVHDCYMYVAHWKQSYDYVFERKHVQSN